MKDHSETSELRTADYRIGDEVPRTALAAADEPRGTFDKSDEDEQGRTTTIEGWADVDANKTRNAGELEAQKDMREAAGSPESQDASHIIPHSIGGRGEDNLVMMSDTMNRSQYKSVEDAAAREAKDAQKSGEDVYVKATVTWGDNEHTPRDVRYEVFRGDKDGDSLRKVQDNEIRTNRVPEKPLNQELLDGPDPGTPRRNHEFTSATLRPKGMTEH